MADRSIPDGSSAPARRQTLPRLHAPSRAATIPANPYLTDEAQRIRTRQRRALIKTGYACNDHCVFCHTDDYRHSGDGETAALLQKIDVARLRGFDMVVFSGGESTMRDDIVQLARHAKTRGLSVGLITNGRRLSYPEFARAMRGANLRYVHLSIHGTEHVHNRMTGDRSFEQSFGGLRNVSGHGLDLTVNCVVTRQNLHDLRGLVELLLPFPDAMLKFSCCEPKGAALRHSDPVVPALGEASAAVVDAIDHGLRLRGAARGPQFAVENFPFCLVGEHRVRDDDLLSNQILAMSEVWDPGLVDIDDFNKVKGPRCAGCRLDAACPGVFVEHYRRFGDAELRPVLEGDLVGPRGGLVVEARAEDVRGVPWTVLREAQTPREFLPPEQARFYEVPSAPGIGVVPIVEARCDAACVFCATPTGPIRASTEWGLKAALRAMYTQMRGVLVTGGEPTRHRALPTLLSYARELGLETRALATNAIALADPVRAAELVDAGLTGVDVPLHGHDARAHQAVTATAGSFKATVTALERLREAGIRLALHATVGPGHARSLPKLLAFMARFEPTAVAFEVPVGSLAPDAATLAQLDEALVDALPGAPCPVFVVAPLGVRPALASRRLDPTSAHPALSQRGTVLLPFAHLHAAMRGPMA